MTFIQPLRNIDIVERRCSRDKLLESALELVKDGCFLQYSGTVVSEVGELVRLVRSIAASPQILHAGTEVFCRHHRGHRDTRWTRRLVCTSEYNHIEF